MTPADFEAAGLYDPAAPEAADRLALLQWLAAQGTTLAQMVEAQRHGSLTGLAGDLTLRAGERLTLAEVAAAAGMSPARIERMRLAAGFPPVDPDEAFFSRDDAETFASLVTGDAFVGEPAMLSAHRSRGSPRRRSPSSSPTSRDRSSSVMRASWRSRRPIFGPLTRSTSSRTVCARCSARTWKPPSAGSAPRAPPSA